MKEAEENKKWWKKKSWWGMVLGLASYACTVIPGAQIAAPPLAIVAAALGWSGVVAAQTRIENTVAKTERVAEGTASKLLATPPPSY